ncbi:MAG TPA: sigma-70 family RNA polymerase sigma factor [Myxococcales bacterium]|jgi:RNA polymerase sigma-70 factor (ECF subfamily)
MTDPPGSGHQAGTGLALPAEVEEATPAAAAPKPRFEEIFRDYFGFAWTGLRRLGVAEASLDDAVQDVFLVVHRRLRDFERRSALKTWLYGIMLRVAHDHRRTRQRKGESEPLDEGLADRRPGPLEAAARAEGLRLLEKLLEGLDEAKRDVLVLADLEQLSAPEIAEIVGVNPNTVYSRLRAAREQFNEAVARYQRGRR